MGFHVYPSHANFILARRRGQNQRHVYESLKSKKILVRYFDAEDLCDCLRISIGSPREMRALVQELRVLNGFPA
jgi:histidinol-phosphate aminotransferase